MYRPGGTNYYLDSRGRNSKLNLQDFSLDHICCLILQSQEGRQLSLSLSVTWVE